MPNLKSSKKRMRQGERCRQRNQAKKSALRSAGRRFLEAVRSGDRTTAARCFGEYGKLLDKGAKAGVIHANQASRRKSGAARKLAGMGAAAGS